MSSEWMDEDIVVYTPPRANRGLVEEAVDRWCPKIDVMEDGHGVLNLDKIDRSTDLFYDFRLHPQSVLGGLTAWARNQDEFRRDAIVILKGEEMESRSLSSVSQSDERNLIKLDARVMDTTSIQNNKLRAAFECQVGHINVKKQHRASAELKKPASCNYDVTQEGDRQDKQCNCPIVNTVKTSKVVHKDVQQVVLAEIDEDDRNSRKLVSEVDNPLINSVDRDDVVEVYAIPLIPDVQKQKTELYLHIVGIELKNDDEIIVTEADVERFKEVVEGSENAPQRISESIAKHIVDSGGHDRAKLAMACSLVAGVGTEVSDSRIHTLLMSEPAQGKSDLIQGAKDVVNGSYVDAGQSTKAGLTGSVRYSSLLQDEDTVMVESGAIPRANESVIAIDEIDKTHIETQSALNTPLQSGMVTITKDGKAVLEADTTVIAAANPDGEVFDPAKTPIEQQPLNDSLFSRFSLVVVIEDEVSGNIETEMEVEKEKMRRRNGEFCDELLDDEFVQKYINYASELEPELTDSAELYIIEKMSELRVQMNSVAAEGLAVSGRVRNTLINVSEAMAKLRLGSKVTTLDTKRAYELIIENWSALIDEDLETAEDIAIAHSLYKNESQRKIIEQAMTTLRVHEGSCINSSVLCDSIDADNNIVEWMLDRLEDEGHIRIDDDEVEVIDLPEGDQA